MGQSLAQNKHASITYEHSFYSLIKSRFTSGLFNIAIINSVYIHVVCMQEYFPSLHCERLSQFSNEKKNIYRIIDKFYLVSLFVPLFLCLDITVALSCINYVNKSLKGLSFQGYNIQFGYLRIALLEQNIIFFIKCLNYTSQQFNICITNSVHKSVNFLSDLTCKMCVSLTQYIFGIVSTHKFICDSFAFVIFSFFNK